LKEGTLIKTVGKFGVHVRADGYPCWIDVTYRYGDVSYFMTLDLNDICDLEYIVTNAISEAIRELSKREPQDAEFLRNRK